MFVGKQSFSTIFSHGSEKKKKNQSSLTRKFLSLFNLNNFVVIVLKIFSEILILLNVEIVLPFKTVILNDSVKVQVLSIGSKIKRKYLCKKIQRKNFIDFGAIFV